MQRVLRWRTHNNTMAGSMCQIRERSVSCSSSVPGGLDDEAVPGSGGPQDRDDASKHGRRTAA
jgi:hypothetical protein